MPYYINRPGHPINKQRWESGKFRFYVFLSGLTFFSYGWICLQYFSPPHLSASPLTICPFKILSSLPCPSCGSTRSILLLLQGHYQDALALNPLGILVAIGMLCIPGWALVDFIFKTQSLYTSFLLLERKIKNEKKFYFPLLGLVLLNWAWNIIKGA